MERPESADVGYAVAVGYVRRFAGSDPRAAPDIGVESEGI